MLCLSVASAGSWLVAYGGCLAGSLAGLSLLLLVLGVRRRRTFAGEAFVALVRAYAVLRYLIEVFRTDSAVVLSYVLRRTVSGTSMWARVGR